jgi:peptidoglycan/xylan/chitin deacetylase (PgdA/CDA1 family)
MWKRRVAAPALVAVLLLSQGEASAADSAVVLSYHRFGDARIPALNTRPDQFDEQLGELQRGGYRVMPLPDIVAALKAGTPLPDKAVAITFDDAAASVHAVAWPRLRQAGLPFTLFVVTDESDHGGDAMSWAQLRELAAAPGVTIASQGAARLHMAKAAPEQIAADLERARGRFEKELGKAPELFAWPYGEASTEATVLVRQAGFAAAFGQHSGAAWAKGDPFFLPRFAINENYGEPERFRLAARALPLPAIDITPADPALKTNPPAFGFTLADEVPGIDGLACFASHQGQVRLERLGPRIEVRMSKPIPAGRGRLNCTVPTLEGRWRWFGWQFTTP